MPDFGHFRNKLLSNIFALQNQLLGLSYPILKFVWKKKGNLRLKNCCLIYSLPFPQGLKACFMSWLSALWLSYHEYWDKLKYIKNATFTIKCLLHVWVIFNKLFAWVTACELTLGNTEPTFSCTLNHIFRVYCGRSTICCFEKCFYN